MKKGLIQIYTGNGKGKTTAAIGLAIRAVGANFKVLFCQFLKNKEYSEIASLKKFELITLKQFGNADFIIGKPSDSDILEAQKGLQFLQEIIKSNRFDMIVLDEINVVINLKLIGLDDFIDTIINQKPATTELILTGRNAHSKLIEIADLVTEMKEVKHYFNKGINARLGIEM